jgi:protein-disulfide isomerase
MHAGLFENQDSLNDPNLALPLVFTLAEANELPTALLRAALARGDYAAKVRNDFLGGVRSGVNGTPTFFVNGRRHDGTYAYDDLVAAIESVLAVTASR